MQARPDRLLRDPEALAARVPPGDRTAIAACLARSRQKVVAGDALWSAGHLAEGLTLARDALAAALEAGGLVAALTGDATVEALLVRRGLAGPAIARVVELQGRRDEPLPRLDADVARSHAALYDALQLARRDLDRALDPAGRTPGAVRLARAGRIALAVTLVALVLTAAWLAVLAS